MPDNEVKRIKLQEHKVWERLRDPASHVTRAEKLPKHMKGVMLGHFLSGFQLNCELLLSTVWAWLCFPSLLK